MRKKMIKNISHSQPLSPDQRLFIKSIRIGMDYSEAMQACGVNSGHLGAWKRWNHNFRLALIDADEEGKPIRRQLRNVTNLIQRYGSSFKPSSSIERVFYAHMRVRTRGRTRARASDEHTQSTVASK